VQIALQNIAGNLLATLVGHGARGFARRLARGLTFAATYAVRAFIGISCENGFDMFHVYHPQ